jgi:hypothetical protein
MLQLREGLKQKAAEASQAKLKESLDAELRQSAGPLEQYGAGVNNLVQGGKQLLSNIPGLSSLRPTDAEIQDRRATNEKLADGKWYNKGLQGAGEAITSLPITLGAAGAIGRLASFVPGVANIASMGGRVANLGAVGSGAVQGATQAALNSTTSDESPGVEAGVGAAAGGALPLLAATLGVGYRGISRAAGPTAERAVKYIRDTVGQPTLDAVNSALSTNKSSLPLSTASLAENTKLAALERGARSRGTTDWAAVKDAPVAEEAWSQLRGIQSRASSELEQAQLDKMTQRFQTARGATRKDVREFGDTPEITAAKLRGTLAQHGEGPSGSYISEEARAGIENLKNELAKHEKWMPANSPGVSRLDDATILNNPGFGYGSPLQPATLTKAAIKALLGKARQASTDLSEQALLEPANWQKLMAGDAARRMNPLTTQELLQRQLMMLPTNTAIAGTGD